MKSGRSIFWLLLIIIVLLVILFLGIQNFSASASPSLLKNIESALHIGYSQTNYLPWVIKGVPATP